MLFSKRPAAAIKKKKKKDGEKIILGQGRRNKLFHYHWAAVPEAESPLIFYRVVYGRDAIRATT